jgi:hypothetical protein
MRVALVKKAAGAFEAVSLTRKAAATPGGGGTPRRVIYAPVSEQKTTRFIPDFSSCRRGGQNHGCLLLLFRQAPSERWAETRFQKRSLDSALANPHRNPDSSTG